MRSRIRTIKPEFFDDPVTGTLEPLARLLFIGMLTLADKRGRLADEPQRIQVRVLPYDRVRIEVLLDSLVAAGLIVRYVHQGQDVIWIKNFEKHQHINLREPESVLPAYEEGVSSARMCVHVQAPSARHVRAHGEREGNGNGIGKGTGTVPPIPPTGGSAATTVVEVVHTPSTKALDDGFEAFWKIYPKKVGKGAARAAWMKLKPSGDVVQAVERQKRSKQWLRESGRFIPNPATWLNQQRWDDQPDPDIPYLSDRTIKLLGNDDTF